MSSSEKQTKFIQTLVAQESAVSVFLVNGIKLQGKISGHDEHTLLLKNTITQMVYKHAISTIVPSGEINID